MSSGEEGERGPISAEAVVEEAFDQAPDSVVVVDDENSRDVCGIVHAVDARCRAQEFEARSVGRGEA